MWEKFDYDKNGMLDKNECSDFMNELVNYILPAKAKNYVKEDFDDNFEKFDDDKNGFIEKSEMAIFIK